MRRFDLHGYLAFCDPIRQLIAPTEVSDMSRIKVAAAIAIGFGILTVISGGSTLFAGLDMGAVVPFVLWFNFLAGFVYVLAGLGLWFGQKWAAWLALALVVATLLIAIGFVVQILNGQAYEIRTVAALAFRSAAWAWITYSARALLSAKP